MKITAILNLTKPNTTAVIMNIYICYKDRNTNIKFQNISSFLFLSIKYDLHIYKTQSKLGSTKKMLFIYIYCSLYFVGRFYQV